MPVATASDRLAIEHQKDVAGVAGGVASAVISTAMGADPAAISTWFFAALDGLMARIQAGYALNRRSTMGYLPAHGALNRVTVSPIPGSLDIGSTRSRLGITGPVAFKNAITAGLGEAQALRSMATQMSGVADELVRNGDRDVIMNTIRRGKGLVAYRRRLAGKSCGFCAMIASRGAVYTAETSTFRTHPHCRCWAEPLYRHEREPIEVQRLQRQWRRVTSGKSGTAAQREWRKHWEQRATPAARAREGIRELDGQPVFRGLENVKTPAPAGAAKLSPGRAKTLADLPRVEHPEDRLAQAMATNPRYLRPYEGKLPANGIGNAATVGYSQNCSRNVVAYEMRRRGIDVTAGAGTELGDTTAIYVRTFRENGRYATRIDADLGRNMSARQVATEVESWPLGGRGIVTLKGHTLSVERDAVSGKAVFVDTQAARDKKPIMDLAAFQRRIKSRGVPTDRWMAVARVDDLDLSDYGMRYVESPELSLADGFVGKTPYPGDDVLRHRFPTLDEIARIKPDNSYAGAGGRVMEAVPADAGRGKVPAPKPATAPKGRAKKPSRKTLRGESEDLSSLKVTELRMLAKERGLTGYSKLTKPQLLERLAGEASAPADLTAAIKRVNGIPAAAPRQIAAKVRAELQRQSELVPGALNSLRRIEIATDEEWARLVASGAAEEKFWAGYQPGQNRIVLSPRWRTDAAELNRRLTRAYESGELAWSFPEFSIKNLDVAAGVVRHEFGHHVASVWPGAAETWSADQIGKLLAPLARELGVDGPGRDVAAWFARNEVRNAIIGKISKRAADGFDEMLAEVWAQYSGRGAAASAVAQRIGPVLRDAWPKVERAIAADVSKLADLSKLKVTELRMLAKERGLTGYSKLTKPQLLERLAGEAEVKAGTETIRLHKAKVESATREEIEAAKIAEIASQVSRRRHMVLGSMSRTERLELRNGERFIHKKITDPDVEFVKRQGDAEELGALVARATGLEAPTVYRAGAGELYMTFMDGELAVDAGILRSTRLAASPEGSVMKVLDYLIGNGDREGNGGNWLIGARGNIQVIDHAAAWGFGGNVPYDASLAAQLSRSDIDVLRGRIKSLRSEFERLGRGNWWRDTMSRVEDLAKDAKGTRALIR